MCLFFAANTPFTTVSKMKGCYTNTPLLQLSQLLLDAEADTGGVAVIGNYLWPNTIAVSGTDNTLERVVEMARERRVKTKRINVAGAFHSPLMSTASVALQRVMGKY